MIVGSYKGNTRDEYRNDHELENHQLEVCLFEINNE
jgi:hypothetical protein